MMKRLSLLTITVGLMLTVAACDLISIDEVEPEQSVSPSQALNSVDGFESVLISSYDRLQSAARYGQVFMLYPDALADGATVTPTNSNRYTGPVDNVQGSHMTTWGGVYAGINETNLVLSQIGGLDIAAPNPEAIQNRIEGEAYFLRALNYFDLARTKGYEPGQEVDGFSLTSPLRLEPTESAEDAAVIPRADNTEIYNQVVSDLNAAITSLTAAEEAGEVNSKNFATAAAAQALLARVSLYTRDWDTAATQAQNAINNSGLELVGPESFADAWAGTTHPESIFELPMTTGTDGDATNTNGSLDALTIGDAQQAFSFEVLPTQDLISLHEEGDVRLELYLEGSKGGDAVTYLAKYPGAIAPNVDPIPVIRLAEMYLIRAEALYEQDDEAGARAALNTLRAARNASEVTATGDALLDAIFEERRLELVYEGHRFFDLKRRGLDMPKPQQGRGLSTLPYSDYRVLAPIPNLQVIEFELTQNPGY